MFQRLTNRLGNVAPWEKTLYILFVAQLTSAIGFSTIFPFLPLYVQELGSTRGWSLEFSIGLVYSISNFSMMIASPIWGVISDRYGRKLMVQRATFAGAILIFLMAFARSAEDLVMIRAIQGVFTGVVSAINALVASQAPRERMGYAMGLIQVGLWAGVAVGPLIGGTIADAYGYEEAIVVTAVLLALSGFLVLFGVKEDFTPSTTGKKSSSNIIDDWRAIIVSPGVGATYLLRFISNMARMAIFPIIPLFLAEILATSDRLNTITGLMLGVTAAASTATAVYLGKLGDRIGHRKIVRACGLAAGLCYIAQSFVTDAWQLLILQALTGAAAGGILPALSALLARYTKPGDEGSVYGIDNSIGAAGRAVSPLIGTGVAFWFGIRSAFAATGVLFLSIALVALWLLPKSQEIRTESVTTTE